MAVGGQIKICFIDLTFFFFFLIIQIECNGKTNTFYPAVHHIALLKHEGQVQVLGPVANVDESVQRRHGHVVEGQAQPQQAADHAHFVGTLKLKTPRSYTHKDGSN